MRNKILFILHIPPPVHGAAVMGGLIMNSKKVNSQFQADFINLTTSFNLNQIGKGSKLKLLTVLKIQFQIVKAILTNNYSLCYVTLTASGLGFYKDVLMVIILKMFRKKIIYHFHNKGVKNNSNTKIKKMLYSFVFNNTKSILLSPFLYEDIKEYVSEQNVLFCPNGVPDLISPDSLNKTIPNKRPPIKFFFLSNMIKKKGVFELLEACKILKDQHLEFECHFVGAWSDVTEDIFNKKVNMLGIKNHINAHGKKYGEDKIDFFMNSDIFVFPSSYDCFPLVLIEAMQYSLPVISTFTGGIPSLVDDQETGILVPLEDPSSLAEAMRLLSKDSVLRNKMGMSARLRYEELFTTDRFENRFIEILETVILENKET